MSAGFRELDDLVLQLKGLVLVRGLRQKAGADSTELAQYGDAIRRVREQLAAAPMILAAERRLTV